MLLDRLVAQYRQALARTHRDVPTLDDLDGFAELGGDVSYDPQVAAALQRGENPPREWERELTGRLRRHVEFRKLLERMWPVLSGAELVHDLFSFQASHPLRRRRGAVARGAGRPVPGPLGGRAPGRRGPRPTSRSSTRPTRCVGPVEAARPRRRAGRGSARTARPSTRPASVVRELGLGGFTTAGQLAARYGNGSGPTDDAIPELRTFGHVLVDEAQDLTPMQWRMLARRCPTGSMTIVGDFGQASRPGAAKGWDDVLALLPSHDAPRRVTLTVNYRTPGRDHGPGEPPALAVAAAGVEPTQSVRRTGRPPSFTRVDDLVAGAAEAARHRGRPREARSR